VSDKEMSEVNQALNKVKASIKSTDWFKKGKWIVSTHEFPAKKPEAVTLHVYKPHWFNEDKWGIHVETFLSYDVKKRKKSYVTVHLCHHSVIPNTKLKRITISKPIVDSIFDDVKSWEGYKFRAGKYGLQPFTYVVDGLSSDFEKVVTREIARVCQLIGPRIDQVLKEVLK
jgi:hypothetical protein